MKQKIQIDIVSDVACPWCYVGKKRLEKALLNLPEVEAEISWQPFQLDPTIPEEGRLLKEYYEAKFGGEDQVIRIHEKMESVGEMEGIAFDFSKMKYTMNTLSLHTLMLQADKEGFKSELKERFFKAYFEDAINLNLSENLEKIMGEFSWRPEKTQEILGDEALKQEVKKTIAFYQSMGVTGVPFFIFNKKYAFSGAQPPKVIVDTIQNILKEEAEKQETILEGESCDIASGEC